MWKTSPNERERAKSEDSLPKNLNDNRSHTTKLIKNEKCILFYEYCIPCRLIKDVRKWQFAKNYKVVRGNFFGPILTKLYPLKEAFSGIIREDFYVSSKYRVVCEKGRRRNCWLSLPRKLFRSVANDTILMQIFFNLPSFFLQSSSAQ